MIQLRTLGVVDLRDERGHDVRAILAQPKRLALFAYLAVARPHGFHRRDILLALFWPELDQQRARAALRKAVHVVRRCLGPDTLVGRGDEDLGVAEALVSCDAVAFERALEGHRFAEALELYQGDLFEGFYVSGAPEFEQWVARERSHYRGLAATAAWAAADSFAAEEQDVLTVQYARRAMDFTPTDEGAVRRLISLLYRMGDRAAALHAYNEFSARLVREYGVRPSAETRKLVEVVKASGEVLRAPSDNRGRQPPSTPSPKPNP